MPTKGLLETWKERDPSLERKYRDGLIERFCSVGKTSDKDADAKSKTFGPAYDLFIIAFFIGLYLDETTALTDRSNLTHFGRMLKVWGVRTGDEGTLRGIRRKDYSRLTDYMFMAVVAKCDNIDYLRLDKGEIELNEVIRKLIDKVEEYTNYGFQYLELLYDKDPDTLLVEGGFFNVVNDVMERSLKRAEGNS